MPGDRSCMQRLPEKSTRSTLSLSVDGMVEQSPLRTTSAFGAFGGESSAAQS